MKKTLPLLLLFVSIGFVGSSQTLDQAFGPKILWHGEIAEALTLANGKTVVAGNFDYLNGVRAKHIARLTTNGQVDNSFDVGEGPDSDIRSFISLPDGKLLVFGGFKNFNGTAAGGIARLNEDGTVDNTFNSSLASEGDIFVLWAGFQSTGKIVVAVGRSAGPSQDYGFSLERLNADGSDDNTFEKTLFPLNPVSPSRISKFAVMTQLQDRIIAVGWFDNFKGHEGVNNLVRLNADGSYDGTFSAEIGPGLSNAQQDILVTSDLGGFITGRNRPAQKFDFDGSVNEGFDAGDLRTEFMENLDATHIISTAYKQVVVYDLTGTIVDQADIDENGTGALFKLSTEKFLVKSVKGDLSANYIIMNSDLTIDDTWSLMVVREDYEYNLLDGLHFLQQPDGKLVVRSFADFYSSGDVSELYKNPGVYRLNTDLSRDETFNFTAPNINHYTTLLHASDNGKNYLCQTLPDGINRQIVRLNADGTVDNTFTPVAGNFNDMAAIDDDDFVGVAFDYSTQKGKVIKFNSSGTVDNMIDITSTGQMNTIDVAEDGSWYVTMQPAGGAMTVNGTEVKRIFKMDPTGAIDGSFDTDLALSYTFKADTYGNDFITAGSYTQSSVGNFPFQQWSANGDPSLVYDDLYENRTLIGDDFIIDGDFIYAITQDNGEFMMFRMRLNGEVDRSFIPVVYHVDTYDGTNSEKPDRLYKLSDGSFMIKGAKLFHIVLPANTPAAPGELTAASTKNLEVNLVWVDNSSDESYFEIERATGSGSFESLGTVPAGTVNYDDHDVNGASTYKYRVRAVNAFGEGDYSNVAEPAFITGLEKEISGLKVFPNPAREHLNIQSDEVVERVTLLQLDGRALETSEPRSKQITMNMTHYPAGLYLLKLEHSAGKKVLKIVKQ